MLERPFRIGGVQYSAGMVGKALKKKGYQAKQCIETAHLHQHHFGLFPAEL